MLSEAASDNALTRVMANELSRLRGSKTARGRRKIDRLEEAGLAVPVVAHDNIEAGCRIEVDPGQVAKITDGEALDEEPRSTLHQDRSVRHERGQIRMGMTTAT